MTEKEELLGEILSRIADELNISKTMYDKAVSSYTAVGSWLDGIPIEVVVMPQGSMNLGTVIRPLNDKDDYDIDLVCLLKTGKGRSPREIKHLIGDRLKEHETYAKKLRPEGRRCWTMDYDEFHMDILPCVPHGPRFVDPGQTAIDLTDKDKTTGQYSFRQSDPAAYREWFMERARPLLILMNEARVRAGEIKPVPPNESRLKTPLQKSIQLLKRHRDVMFSNRQDVAPISMIITTLAARACPHESNVYRALKTIIERMEEFVEKRQDGYWVANPVMPNENFAEKWNSDPEKREAFTSWHEKVRRDFLLLPSSLSGLDEYARHFEKVLRPEPVKRAFNSLGDSMRTHREKGSLILTGLSTGLAVSKDTAGRTVLPHTFYGQ